MNETLIFFRTIFLTFNWVIQVHFPLVKGPQKLLHYISFNIFLIQKSYFWDEFLIQGTSKSNTEWGMVGMESAALAQSRVSPKTSDQNILGIGIDSARHYHFIFIYIYIYIYTYIYIRTQTKCVKKVLRLKLYLPRQKWTMNKTLIFFKIIISVFSTVSQLINVFLKILLWCEFAL